MEPRGEAPSVVARKEPRRENAGHAKRERIAVRNDVRELFERFSLFSLNRLTRLSGNAQVDIRFFSDQQIVVEGGEPRVQDADEDIYTQRPDALQHLCAYELFAQYSKGYEKRKKLLCPVVKPYIKLDLAKAEDDPMFIKYCEQHLRVFKPWRFDLDLYGEHVDEHNKIDWPAAYDEWMDSGDAPLLEQRKYQRAIDKAIDEVQEELAEEGRDDESDEDGGVDINFHDSGDERDIGAASQQNWEDELFRPNPDFQGAGGDDPSHALGADISFEQLAGDLAHTRTSAAAWLDQTIKDSPPTVAAPQLGLAGVDPSALEGEQRLAVRVVREHLLAHLERPDSPSSPRKHGAFTHS